MKIFPQINTTQKCHLLVGYTIMSVLFSFVVHSHLLTYIDKFSLTQTRTDTDGTAQAVQDMQSWAQVMVVVSNVAVEFHIQPHAVFVCELSLFIPLMILVHVLRHLKKKTTKSHTHTHIQNTHAVCQLSNRFGLLFSFFHVKNTYVFNSIKNIKKFLSGCFNCCVSFSVAFFSHLL